MSFQDYLVEKEPDQFVVAVWKINKFTRYMEPRSISEIQDYFDLTLTGGSKVKNKRKINMNPKTAEEMETALNDALYNLHGDSKTSYVVAKV